MLFGWQGTLLGTALILFSIFLVWWGAPPPKAWDGSLHRRGLIAGPIIGICLVAAIILLFGGDAKAPH